MRAHTPPFCSQPVIRISQCIMLLSAGKYMKTSPTRLTMSSSLANLYEKKKKVHHHDPIKHAFLSEQFMARGVEVHEVVLKSICH